MRTGVQATIGLSETSEVQPDAFLLRVEPPGRARITERGYIEGAPELIVEVAASSASNDLHDKMEAYRRAGVEEYIVWQVLEERIDWFRLRHGRYERLQPDVRGIITSEVFSGLCLDVRAKVLTALTPPRKRRTRP